MKPVIGISVEPFFEPENARTRGRLHLNWNYPEIVSVHGGTPILLPPTADPVEIARLLDGWLIPGGRDLDPAIWGEASHPENELQDPSRFAFEKALYAALEPETPILGICYGCQTLNVLRGGTLEQHLPDRVGHDRHTSGEIESLKVESGARLQGIFGAEAKGKSYHHQAIGALGCNLTIAARSEDDVIEAIEATDRPWEMAVQWHPERTPENEGTKKLLDSFIEAAIAYATQRRRA